MASYPAPPLPSLVPFSKTSSAWSSYSFVPGSPAATNQRQPQFSKTLWNPLGTLEDKENHSLFAGKSAPGTPIAKSFAAAVTLLPNATPSPKRVTFAPIHNAPSSSDSDSGEEMQFQRFERTSFIASNSNRRTPLSTSTSNSATSTPLNSHNPSTAFCSSSAFLRHLDEEELLQSPSITPTQQLQLDDATTPRRNSIFGGALRVPCSTPSQQPRTPRPERAATRVAQPQSQPAPAPAPLTERQQPKSPSSSSRTPAKKTKAQQQQQQQQQSKKSSTSTANANAKAKAQALSQSVPRKASGPRSNVTTATTPVASRKPPASTRQRAAPAPAPAPAAPATAASKNQKKKPAAQQTAPAKTVKSEAPAVIRQSQSFVATTPKQTPTAPRRLTTIGSVAPQTPSAAASSFAASFATTTPRSIASASGAKVFCTPARRANEAGGSTTGGIGSSKKATIRSELANHPFMLYIAETRARYNTPARIESYCSAINELTSQRCSSHLATSSVASVALPKTSDNVASSPLPMLPRQDSAKRRLDFDDDDAPVAAAVSPSSYAEAVTLGIKTSPSASLSPSSIAMMPPTPSSAGSSGGSGSGKRRRKRKSGRRRSSASSILESVPSKATAPSSLPMLPGDDFDLSAQLEGLEKSVKPMASCSFTPTALRRPVFTPQSSARLRRAPKQMFAKK